MHSGSYVYWFGDGQAELSLLGGKAMGLDWLATTRAGTPPGFCLTTAAYRRYFQASNLASRLQALCQQLPDESARQELAALAHAYPFPEDVAAALQASLSALSERVSTDTLLAVRSSGVSEDSSLASFAGQHVSVLGVPFEGVEKDIRTCWSSVWSSHAVAYRSRLKLGLGEPALAVIVQALVPAEVSAVVFTSNPMTGRNGEILVNAAWGLGVAVVSGIVIPDTILMDKTTLRVRQVELGEKPVQVVVREGGGVDTVPTLRQGLALSEEALTSLGELCRGVEDAFGEPVDIEAALAGGQWYILQVRPITAV